MYVVRYMLTSAMTGVVGRCPKSLKIASTSVMMGKVSCDIYTDANLLNICSIASVDGWIISSA